MSDEIDPDSDILVCGLYTAPQQPILPDNVIDTCAQCGRAIQYRPYHNDALRKVCVPCVVAMARPKRGDNEDPGRAGD